MVGELEVDVEIKAPAQKYYHMLTGRQQDLPKATPDNIKRCDVLEGEPGKVGNILFWNYVVGEPKSLDILFCKNIKDLLINIRFGCRWTAKGDEGKDRGTGAGEESDGG
ncbi:hypothetical protein DY000_02017369 [Brassica cretica]|uniref:Bet v I/Major latex protein domain-containing protein n=1 Tax=Brassica cretica TaxID=69181 RepID=A0ABQ7CYL6_BRACR|nr:hypothetical protein DY000_02017369 [Brassica cretica]